MNRKLIWVEQLYTKEIRGDTIKGIFNIDGVYKYVEKINQQCSKEF